MNIVGIMQRWMDSKVGQTFLNYAYSWGAAVVILGTLFKLTHLPGANLMLFLGMGTEVVVFFLSAFDRPFDKGERDIVEGNLVLEDGNLAGGTIIVTGNTGSGSDADQSSYSADVPSAKDKVSSVSPFKPSAALQAAAAEQGIAGENLLEIIRLANEEILQHAQASLTPEMEEASRQYVDKLQQLTETLDRVEKQSARLTTDSEEMTNLNRTLTGINTVYELQLKSVSQQIGTIDSINEQTRRMAAQIEELNGVYARMIKALTVNMKNAATTIDE